ncbi:MAG: S-layer homology domain-containing protein, partial [Tissierellia bacterium]|nr:S-layer homology domain-containing protein [Tissierellia bacterium]
MKRNHRILYSIIGLIVILSSSTISLAMATDIKGNWAEDYIVQLIEKGAMPIYPDGTFKPNNSITRGEFIKAVNNIFEFEEMVEIQFKDINEEDPFYNDIKKAVAAGYINGYEDGTVKTKGFITRQEASKILVIASNF